MFVLQGAKEKVESLQFSPDGRTLAAPCADGVQLWHDPAGGPPETRILYPAVRAVRFTPDGRKLLLARLSDASLHDLPSGQTAAVSLPVVPESNLWEAACDLTPDGRHLLFALTSPFGRPPGWLCCLPLKDPGKPVWSLVQSRRVFPPPLPLAGGGRFVLFEWRSEGGYDYGMVYVTRETRTGDVVSEVPTVREEYLDAVQSADRRLVAARNGVWAAVYRTDDFAAGPVVLRNDNRKKFTGLAFHPSGRYLAATSNDATVKLYDTATWAVAAAYDWRIGRLRSVCFSPDGMRAAAGGDKGQIVVWDVDV
jgi:WD40 repeat protein